MQYPREAAAHAFDTLQNSGMNWMTAGERERISQNVCRRGARLAGSALSGGGANRGMVTRGAYQAEEKKDGGMDGLRSRWDGRRALV